MRFMSGQEQSRLRYQAKAARRPILYWWQAFVLLGGVVLLWCQLPLTAVLYDARSVPPLPEPRAAYVVLDPSYAAQAFKKSLTAWTLGGGAEKRSAGLELSSIDMESTLRSPEYLEQGARFPGVWQPSVVRPLDQALPEIGVGSAGASAPPRSPREQETGVRVALSPALASLKFTFPEKQEAPPERSGQCRFYVETGADGAVEHVLLLTARTPGAAVFERALSKGRARGAGCGFVDLYWSFPKS
jgi:hypothetical protein